MVFKETISREYSLIRIGALYEAMTYRLKDLIGTTADACFIYGGGDLATVCFEQNTFVKINAKTVQKCKNDKFIEKLFSQYLEVFEELKPFFDKQKTPQNIKQFKEIIELFSKYWAHDLIIYDLPKLAIKKEFINKALALRKVTQDYSEGIENVISAFLINEFPLMSKNQDKMRFVLPDEIWDEKIKNRLLMPELIKRSKGYVFYNGKIYCRDKDKILNKLDIQLYTYKQEGKEIKGLSACKGKASGLVKIVSGVKDLDKVDLGNILVASMTMPKYLPAMKKASAFITDEGGITCHAAIIAREIGKPCVIGTKIATKILKDGDLVEVNADEGIIKILN
ncbi:MAG: PEP-utilizing enzyme [Candidatus Buchananbacteria bacterium]